MKLIVGLGNPGKEYKNTRHNIGFNAVDYYLQKKNILDKWTKKFDGEYLSTVIDGEKIMFLKPHTFMNLSGLSVKKIVDYFNISIDDILIIADDLDLLLGNFKLRPSGSCGGHNGLRDIEKAIGTTEYKRLKIGIGNSDIDTKEYVTSRLSKNDMDIITKLFDELNKVLDDYFKYDFDKLMALYNKKNK